MLCNTARGVDPWTGSGVCRLLAREVIPVQDIISSSATHVTWATDSFVGLTARCERERLALFIAHNHVSGMDWFSGVDDDNERRLFPYALDKMGEGAVVGSLLLRCDRSLTGRVWLDEPMRSDRLASVTTVGEAWKFEFAESNLANPRAILHRQELALGPAFCNMAGSLRISVVGCGATGSATAMLLARLGVGHLLLVDGDIVDVTNLNRLYGATQSDADAGRKKSEVIANAIASLGLGCQVRSMDMFVESEAVRNELKACDIIFACTDDRLGRGVLNRFAYFYLTPVIDVGLAMCRSEQGHGFAHIDGRVTVLHPGTPCLLCRDVINAEGMHADATRRADPLVYERLKAEGYIIGAGVPNPAVVTFTTQTAAMGVDEMIQRLTHFRGPRASSQRNRHFLEPEDSTGGPPSRNGCRVCKNPAVWGRGDCEPFLGMTM